MHRNSSKVPPRFAGFCCCPCSGRFRIAGCGTGQPLSSYADTFQSCRIFVELRTKAIGGKDAANRTISNRATLNLSYATEQQFPYEKSEETDQTDALPRTRTPPLRITPDRAPKWAARTTHM